METSKVNLVYVLGTSYSGSTVLGFLLGSSARVFSAGEMNFYNKGIQNETCSCGKINRECPFWKDIYGKDYDISVVPRFLKKIQIIFQILFQKKFPKGNLLTGDNLRLLNDIQTQAKGDSEKVEHILDDSKNLWRLIQLLRYENITVQVLYLKRDINGNVASFVKNGQGFWKGLCVYILSHYLMKKFLKNNEILHLNVSYNKLCENDQDVLGKIGDFLGINYSHYRQDMKLRKYHVPSGNKGARKQFLQDFSGLKLDESWKERLTKFQKFILSFFK